MFGACIFTLTDCWEAAEFVFDLLEFLGGLVELIGSLFDLF
jgi:hypothetical protein